MNFLLKVVNDPKFRAVMPWVAVALFAAAGVAIIVLGK